MRVSDIVERLVALGLTPQEAEAYVHLTRSPGAKASDVGRTLRVGRTDAYRTLKRLVDRGYATQTLEQPVTFEAAPPDRVFQILRSHDEAHLASIAQTAADVGPALGTLRAADAESGAPKSNFRVVHGRGEIAELAAEEIALARRSLEVVWMPPTSKTRPRTQLPPHLLDEAVARGVRVDVVASLLTTPLPEPPPWSRRVSLVPRVIRFIVRDREELVMLVADDPDPGASAPGDVAIHTNAPDFVAAQVTLFEKLWAEAIVSSTR